MDPFTIKETLEIVEKTIPKDPRIPSFKVGMDSPEPSFGKDNLEGLQSLSDDIPEFPQEDGKEYPGELLGDDIIDRRGPPPWLDDRRGPPPVNIPIEIPPELVPTGIDRGDPGTMPGDGTIYNDIDPARVDGNGNIYKDEEGNLLPNTEFEINGIHYQTDDLGRVTDCEGNLKDTPEKREDSAGEIQQAAGENDRQEGDHGGHLVAHMNGGSSGSENVVAMRGHLNQADYKKCELEENQILKDGHEVHESIHVTYEGDSQRPSMIEKTYTDGEKTVVAKFDNNAGSTELLNDVKGDISEDDYQSLEDEITDMQNGDNDVSVTSVKKEYDSDGNLTKVTVGVRDEGSGTKEYKSYTFAD